MTGSFWGEAMDLGLRGRRALVCGASKGLGRASAAALAAEGMLVTIIAREEAELRLATQDIERSSGMPVGRVACDITTEHGHSAVRRSPACHPRTFW